MTSLKNTISILSTLSAAGFDWAIGLVRRRFRTEAADGIFHVSDVFLQTFSPENALHAGLAILLSVRVFFTSYVRILVILVS